MYRNRQKLYNNCLSGKCTVEPNHNTVQAILFKWKYKLYAFGYGQSKNFFHYILEKNPIKSQSSLKSFELICKFKF